MKWSSTLVIVIWEVHAKIHPAVRGAVQNIVLIFALSLPVVLITNGFPTHLGALTDAADVRACLCVRLAAAVANFEEPCRDARSHADFGRAGDVIYKTRCPSPIVDLNRQCSAASAVN